MEEDTDEAPEVSLKVPFRASVARLLSFIPKALFSAFLILQKSYSNHFIKMTTIQSVRYASKTMLSLAVQQQNGLRPAFVNAMNRPLFLPHSCLSTTTESKGPLDWITSKITDREKTKQDQQFKDQIKRMAESERWTLKDFNHDLDLSLKGWRMYVPGIKDNAEVKSARTAQAAVKAFGDEIGLDSTFDDLRNLGRTEKVSLC